MTALRALGVAVALLVIWQAIVLIFQPPSFMLPDPARVFAALVERPDLWRVACGDDADRDRDRSRLRRRAWRRHWRWP